MFKKLLSLFSKSETSITQEVKLKHELEKEAATAKNEPWVAVLGIDVDPDDIGSGAFNLDWNSIFIARLVKAGYVGKTDVDIIDQWFQTICRNIALETFENEIADPEKRAAWNARISKLNY